MASLSNINGIFDVHSTGAIKFNGNYGTAGQILKSNGNAAPTWVAPSTVIGGPYLPLTGGTLTGATATASGISFTVGGTLTVETGINLESGVLVIKNATGDSNGLRIFQDSSDASKIYNNYNGTLQLGVGNTTAITIDSSENTTFAGAIFLINTSARISAGGSGEVGFNYNTSATGSLVWYGGTTSSKFSVTNTGDATFAGNLTLGSAKLLKFGGNGARIYGDNTNKFLTFDTDSLERMRINSSGNVGIGVAPTKALQVSGEALFGNGTDGLLLSYSGGNSSGIIDTGHSSTALEFRVGNTQELLINGTSATFAGEVNVPSGKISILGGNNLTISGTAANHAGLSFGTNIIYPATAAGTNDNTFDLGDPDERFKDLYLGGSITAGGGATFTGNVGIGTTNPQVRLDIAGDVVIPYGNKYFMDTVGAARSNFLKTINDFETVVGTGRGSAGFGVFGNSNIRLGFGTSYTTAQTSLFINSSGNVGIGTTSPNQDGFGASTKVLSLKGNSSGGEAVLELIGLGNADNDQVGVINFMSQAATSPLAAIKGLRHTSDESGKLTFLTAGSERMRITETGNVKIGTATTGTPAANADDLVIDKGAVESGISIISTTASSLRFGDAADTSIGSVEYNHTSNYMRFIINSAEQMKISDNLIVFPSAGVNELRGDISSDKFAIGNMGDASSQMMVSSRGFLTFNVSNTGSAKNTTERMRITSAGNVGIGTTSPGEKLEVNGIIQIKRVGDHPAIRFVEDTTTRGYIGTGDWAVNGLSDADLGISSASTGSLVLGTNSGSGRVYIVNGGNVGIGTTSPTYKLHVVSSNNVSIFEDTSDASGAAFIVFNRPGVFSMGSITRNGSANSVSYNTGSDYRLKEDLKDFNALDLVNNITAYDYKWKDVDQRDYGFIAHELKQTLPNVVTGEKDGEKMQGVDYSKLTPILLKAIQELEARVKELENK